MTMYSDTYYIMHENNDGTFSCIQSYKDIEKAKQHAKNDFRTIEYNEFNS